MGSEKTKPHQRNKFPATRGGMAKMMQKNGEFLAALRVQNMASRDRGRLAAISQNFRGSEAIHLSPKMAHFDI